MLRSYINHQFKSTVWRLEIDPISETVFVEIRDQADKQVSFAAISLDSGKVYFDNLHTEERWLTGIEAAYDGVLLVHNYQSEAGPTHKGVIAIEGRTGEILWNNYTHAFDHLSASGPVTYDSRLQPAKLLLAHIKTGVIRRPFEPSIDSDPESFIVLPERISSDFFKYLPVEKEPFGNEIDYLEHNNLRIVSLHTFAKGALQQHFCIFSGEQVVYEDLLNTDIQKLQPESFLMYRDRLIYLKDKSQLKVLNL